MTVWQQAFVTDGQIENFCLIFHDMKHEFLPFQAIHVQFIKSYILLFENIMILLRDIDNTL